MARARILKPSFFTNDELAQVGPWGRLLFAGLWTVADREGRVQDRPLRIKAHVFPFDDVDVGELVGELASAGLVHRYEVGAQQYICIPTFHRHQKIHHREADSELPPCPCCAEPEKGTAQPLPSPQQAPTEPPPSRSEALITEALVTEAVSEAVTEDDTRPPVDVVEIRDLILSKLSTRFQRDPVTWDEAEQFAWDFRGQFSDVASAIAEFRRNEQGPPFPQKLRRYMPQAQPPPLPHMEIVR